MKGKNTVLPPGFVVTKCPPGVANAKSLKSLRREEESALEAGFEGRVDRLKARRGEYRDGDCQKSEVYMETVCGARMAGLSSSDALDAGRDAVDALDND